MLPEPFQKRPTRLPDVKFLIFQIDFFSKRHLLACTFCSSRAYWAAFFLKPSVILPRCHQYLLQVAKWLLRWPQTMSAKYSLKVYSELLTDEQYTHHRPVLLLLRLHFSFHAILFSSSHLSPLRPKLSFQTPFCRLLLKPPLLFVACFHSLIILTLVAWTGTDRQILFHRLFVYLHPPLHDFCI